jgi:hypothetical protein
MTATAAAFAHAADWQAPTRGIGDNSGASLAEVLAEETAPLAERARALADGASRAVVTDEETAGKATVLAKMIKDHLKTIEEAREDTKAPYLKAGRVIDDHFGEIAGTLATLDPKKKLTGGPLHTVFGLIDGYRAEQQRLADIETKRLEDEAAAARAAAAAAEAERLAAVERERQAVEEAARAGDNEAKAIAEAAAAQSALAAEIAKQQYQDNVARLTAQAAAPRAAVIDTGLGVKASGRTTYQGQIVDFDKAIRWAIKLDRPAILAAVQGVVDRQVRAKNHAIPGVEVKPVTSTVIR